MITSITMWLAVGERGLSSEAIALATLGLRRCLLLLEKVPETREHGLLVLAERCPKWAALVKVWNRLSETLRSETGENLPPRGSAPKTYALMEEALDSATRS